MRRCRWRTSRIRLCAVKRVTNFANNVPNEVAQITKLRKVYPTPENVLRLRPAKQSETLPA